MYPFYGTTSEKGLTSNPGYKASQQSYGMWMVPPDVGNMVLVIFVEGQLNKGYWIGCVQQELRRGDSFHNAGYPPHAEAKMGASGHHYLCSGEGGRQSPLV